MNRPALLCLDLINELVHPDGHYAHVCLEHAEKRDTLGHAAAAVSRARMGGIPVIHVMLAFSTDYADWPVDSMLFGSPDPECRLRLGSWGSQFHDRVAPVPGEEVIVKRRVSPFYGTSLEQLLRAKDIDQLLLAGVATDLVVLSTAREAHDRGFAVEILEDATATAHQKLHEAALMLLARTATVTTVGKRLPPSHVEQHLHGSFPL